MLQRENYLCACDTFYLELLRVDYFYPWFWHHVRDDNLIKSDANNTNKHFWRCCRGRQFYLLG